MSTISPISPSPRGRARARDNDGPLLLHGPTTGQGSLAPSDTVRRAPLLLGDPFLGHGSLAPAHGRPARKRAARGTPPTLLEDALAAYVVSLSRHQLERQRLRAVIERLGVGGRPPLTLAEAGRMAGLSGERVRQLEARVRKQRQAQASPANIPQLEAALSAVARALPMPASGVARLLLEAGVSGSAFSAESLRCAAELAGYDLPFVFSGSGRHTVLLPRAAASAVAHAPVIESRARRQAERCGASTIEELERELSEDDGLSVSRRQLRLVLENSQSVTCLAHGWFAFRDARCSGAFVRATLRMLAVTPALSFDSLRDGLRRHNAFRRIPAPPPASVLAEVYRLHPGFRVVDGRVSSVAEVDPAVVGPLNKRMVEILQSAPGGALPRSQLLDACHQAGLNLTSVNLYTTYSECLERVAPGLFAARGTVAPGEVSAGGRRRSGARPDDGPCYGWTADGRPWLAGRITPSTWANGVIHVPAELRPVLAGRHFPCHDCTGARVTTIGIDRHGNSWGWTGFLRRAGAELGDLMRAVFDPAEGTAVLEVVPADSAAPDF